MIVVIAVEQSIRAIGKPRKGPDMVARLPPQLAPAGLIRIYVCQCGSRGLQGSLGRMELERMYVGMYVCMYIWHSYWNRLESFTVKRHGPERDMNKLWVKGDDEFSDLSHRPVKWIIASTGHPVTHMGSQLIPMSCADFR